MIYNEIINYSEKFIPIVCCIKEGGEVAEKIKQKGIKLYVLNRMQSHGFDWKAVKDLYNIIKKEKVDILRTHQYHANLYGRIAGKLAGVPLILPTFHNVYVSPKRPKWHRRVFNKILSYFSDYLIAVSEAVASDIVKYDWIKHSKVKVIYNGISVEKFKIAFDKREIRKKFNLSTDKIIIGTVGRLHPAKGQEYLIKAVADIKNVTIVIAGEGELKDYLKNIANKYNVELILLGNLDNEEIPYFLKSIDIFCFPSLWEGLPLAVIEAMAAELPIVASDIPSLVGILGDCALYFPAKDVENLRKILLSVINSEDKRKELSTKAKMRVENFSIKNVVRKYESLFLETLRLKGIQ
ncbi:glycosyltransferase family 4 protein [Thermodesulfovibrio hydrogeniphilus]